VSAAAPHGGSLAQTYDDAFYDDLAGDVQSAADVVVPLVLGMLGAGSVLDVGCGRGTWLAAFRRRGVDDVVGVDGPHVHASDLEIPADRFVAHDLSRPLDLGRTFDLVVSLEVAEHLDPDHEAQFVDSLVAHGPAVLFSAAIPHQGGAGHVNEQWPSHWARLFEARGYAPLDVVRPAVWTDERVPFWYAQNTVLYVAREQLRSRPGLADAAVEPGRLLDLVHPGLYLREQAARRAPAPPPSVRRSARLLVGACRRALRRRAYRALPSARRVKPLGGVRGRGRLQARKLLPTRLQRPVVVETATGLRLRITADPVDEIIAHNLLGGRRAEYFPPWPTPLPSGMCILDVGAHHGLYAAAALDAFPDSRIVCVEPSADAAAALRANLELNGFAPRARVVVAGLAAEHGTGELRHTAEGSWGASLHEPESAALAKEEVPLLPLAAILDGDVPDIVKCNAEGAEYTLFDQMERSGLRPRFLLVMVHPEFGDMGALLERARAMGYSITRTGTPGHPAFQMWHSPGGEA
jgi:FkbM family methyltransferase